MSEGPRVWKAEAGGFLNLSPIWCTYQVPGQLGIYTEILSQKEKKNPSLCAEVNLESRKEQQVLLTTDPFLRPQNKSLKSKRMSMLKN